MAGGSDRLQSSLRSRVSRVRYVESRPRVVVLPHNLPLQLSSLVGRKREISQVSVLLRNARLLTLCGPGGIGKTRIALAVAEAMLDEFPQGVWLVELASLADPLLVSAA